jgi:hypothetical protein
MTLFDPVAAQALLEIQDAELRRRFELALVRVAGLATVLNLDLSSIRDESAAMRKKPDSTRRKPTPACLIAKAKLLHESDFCAAIGITDQSLSKDITVRRIFKSYGDAEAALFALNDVGLGSDDGQLCAVAMGASGRTC